jgi:hypothetical protein
MKWKWGLIVLIILSVVVAGFWMSGGHSLVNLYRNYLSQDMPDKKYSWNDFSERGAQEPTKGYYGGVLCLPDESISQY